MKTKLKNSLFIFLLLPFSSLFFASCDKEQITPKDRDKDTTACACKNTVAATVRNNICGVGLWGSYVLELENGDIVQPWAADSASLSDLQLADGQKINVSFSKMDRDNRYDNRVVCLAIGPYQSKYAVNIHCIKPILQTHKPENHSDSIFTITAEVVDWTCAAVGVWDGIQFKTEKGEYLQPWELLLKIVPSAIELKAQQQVSITYSVMKADNRYKNKQVCPTFAALPRTTVIRVHNISILKN